MHPEHQTSGRPSPASLALWAAVVLCLWTNQANAQNAPVRISQDQAVQAALKSFPGKVTDVALEKKHGKTVYVIEMTPDQGKEETDVLVDSETGQVLGIEK